MFNYQVRKFCGRLSLIVNVPTHHILSSRENPDHQILVLSTMKFRAILGLLLCGWDVCHSFAIPHPSDESLTSSKTSLASTASPSDGKPTNLVRQAHFINSVDLLKTEIAKQRGEEYVKDEKLAYMLGKVKIAVPAEALKYISMAQVDDAELVLITGVPEEIYEHLQPLDTITQITLPGSNKEDDDTEPLLDQNTNSLPIEELGPILSEALALADEKGIENINLEINRLIKGYMG